MQPFKRAVAFHGTKSLHKQLDLWLRFTLAYEKANNSLTDGKYCTLNSFSSSTSLGQKQEKDKIIKQFRNQDVFSSWSIQLDLFINTQWKSCYLQIVLNVETYSVIYKLRRFADVYCDLQQNAM